MTIKNLLTTVELSERLKVSTKTLELWRKLNKGPPWHKVGRSVRYDEDECVEWMRSQRQDGAER